MNPFVTAITATALTGAIATGGATSCDLPNSTPTPAPPPTSATWVFDSIANDHPDPAYVVIMCVPQSDARDVWQDRTVLSETANGLSVGDPCPANQVPVP